jgi:hypothetical protein
MHIDTDINIHVHYIVYAKSVLLYCIEYKGNDLYLYLYIDKDAVQSYFCFWLLIVFLYHILSGEKMDSRSIALAQENKRLRAELESMRRLVNRGEEPVVTGEGVETSGGGGGGRGGEEGGGGGGVGGTPRTDVVTVCSLKCTVLCP